MRPNEFFSHETAAKIYEVPPPRELEQSSSVHISVEQPAFPPRIRGVIGHRLRSPITGRTHRGFQVVEPAAAWCQLGALLADDDLVVAGDYLVRRKRPLCNLDQLRTAVEAMGSARGARAMRTALGRVRGKTDSPMETRLRLLIVANNLPEPIIGYTVTNKYGDFVATPDLSYPNERIAIEYEGEIHRTDAQVYAADIERRERLEEAGWLVIRVVKQHLTVRTGWLLTRIRTALAARTDL
ncbi:hypothetical protein [Glaciihabitans sp. UYNi722]|uniref:endonuclease domain-containing protein n=1 Tax=Glaciihabitans sp. UYNi722 TaxID=3156344 RepID=UPI00339B2EDB